MDDAVMEAIAEGVHIAWMDEKRAQGFADHPWPPDWRVGVHHSVQHGGPCALAYSHHHTDMVPYADLPEHVKQYDRVTARAAIEGITAAGYRLVKDEAAVRAN